MWVFSTRIGDSAFCPKSFAPMNFPLTGLIASGLLLSATLQAQTAPAGTFDPDFHAPKQVFDRLLPLPDGRYLAAGDFRFLDGVQLNRLARLNADGSVDPSFDSGEGVGDVKIHGMMLQSDRRIIVFGNFREYQGATRFRIARLLPNGALDETFNPPESAIPFLNSPIVTAAFAPADQGIYIGGGFAGLEYGPAGLARLLPDGSVDTAFKPDKAELGAGSIDALAVDPAGRVLAAGALTGGYGIRRFLADGSVDRTFKKVVFDRQVTRVLVCPDGRVLVGGAFMNVNAAPRLALVRLLADGAVDSAFRPATEPFLTQTASVVRDLALLADGSVMVAGEVYSGREFAPLLTHLKSDGSPDPSFAHAIKAPIGSYSRVLALALNGNGSLVIGGVFQSVNHPQVEYCARLSLGEVPTAPTLRIAADGLRLMSQVHPGRRLVLETADQATGPWSALASTNPVASGIWSVSQPRGDRPAGFFRVR